jgi:hypothetical protein
MLRHLILPALALAPFAGAVALAAPLDGSQPVICSTLQVFSCDAGADCEAVTVEEANAPQFLRLNFVDMAVQSDRPDGQQHKTSIATLAREERQLLLQGNDEGNLGRFAWNMLIRKADGRMTLAVAGEDIAFVLFGACTTATVAGTP